jgi:dihydropyrimidinase
MTPPIRPEQERVILNKNINWISTIGTDHCPYTKQQKNQLYTKDIPMGIGGVRYSFLNMYETYGFSILDKFTKGPAKAYGLEDKGSLIPGMDADIVIFNQHKNTEVKDEMSVYDRHIYQGKIETVLVRGSICLQQEKLYSHTGKYIKRGGCNERY